MRSTLARRNQLSRPVNKASQVLSDFLYWLKAKKYARPENYVTNAKTFLKTYKAGSLTGQLATYASTRSYSLRSTLNRFREFLVDQTIDSVLVDLAETGLPRSNAFVKLFLYHHKDHLAGDKSLTTYATILNNYFETIDNHAGFVSKKSAERFIHSPDLSDFTKRLYKAVLKAFCEWVAEYQQSKTSELNREQRLLKKALSKISYKSLREIISIKVRSRRGAQKGYHKDSLTMQQRNKLLSLCKDARERAIVSLMAWNGLRTVEITRLNLSNVHFSKNRLDVWSKGKASKSRDTVALFSTCKKELKQYLRLKKTTTGKLFPHVSTSDIDQMIRRLFKQMRLKGKYSPHSLRHTAGQIMYDQGIRLEFIQKTLRHAMMETTKVYAQRAIDRSYFLNMKLS